MEYFRTAETPTGEHYVVVTAPPGSALDAGGGSTGGGPIGGLLALVVVATRIMCRGWRIAVSPCDERGRLRAPTYRERVPDEHAAEARTQEIVRRIHDGSWPE